MDILTNLGLFPILSQPPPYILLGLPTWPNTPSIQPQRIHQTRSTQPVHFLLLHPDHTTPRPHFRRWQPLPLLRLRYRPATPALATIRSPEFKFRPPSDPSISMEEPHELRSPPASTPVVGSETFPTPSPASEHLVVLTTRPSSPSTIAALLTRPSNIPSPPPKSRDTHLPMTGL
ncbi:IgG receptor FcRn large subunit p51 [Striga asiatica]|uniref:IgG receptor FcRn large subunit p51 n=1 Tax=Striga asiatica TaxID=4170 RepID=A0A5A7PAL2_STRAF|nr:IgG receptor FcRn large subunit p51 [Striga asiatica]